ncbi:L-threonine 3-dehydrogenase [subsurface metagenome]
MKAVVKTSQAPGAELKDVDIPIIGPRDVLIKVKAAAICGSDIHIFHSSPGIMHMVKTPLTFGHEAAGEVVSTGDMVSSIKKGDRVAVETHFPCGHCYYCQTGAQHNCSNLVIFGVQTDGAFAEYAKVPEVVCWKLPQDYSYDLGSILEPLGVAVHGAMVEDVNGKSVAVFGCGPIGLFAIGAVTAFGATKVFALEVASKRLAMARQLFSSAILINPKEQDPIKTITEATDGLGVDVAIELSGNPAAIKQAFKVLKREGRISLIGIPPGPVELEIHKDIILKETRVHGSFGRLMWQTWWQVRNLLAMDKFDPLSVITHRFPLVDYAKALELAASGEAGKILLYP